MSGFYTFAVEVCELGIIFVDKPQCFLSDMWRQVFLLFEENSHFNFVLKNEQDVPVQKFFKLAVRRLRFGQNFFGICPDFLQHLLDERLASRIAMLPLNQLIMIKLFINQTYQSMGIVDNTQVIGTLLDGIARHTPEGIAWRETAVQYGIKHALKERDGRFGDYTQRKKS